MRTVLLVIVILTMSEPASAWISQIRHGRSRSRLTRQMKKNDENGVVETTTTTTTTMEDPSTILSTSTNWDSYNVTSFDNVDSGATLPPRSPAQQTYDLQGDIVTKFLRIVESQQQLGGNCTAGTDLNLGEGVVDKYAQERFRVEAEVAVNRANLLTRMWKYAPKEVLTSEYLLHAMVFSMVEFDEDIFAAGNCYDQHEYKDYWLFCPYAYRLSEGALLGKDLAVEYKYLSNTSEWFYIARKNAERVIRNCSQFKRGYNSYAFNDTAHTDRVPDEILSVGYEDGKWSKPYYDCGGGNIWMLTYTVPFFGYANGSYFFKGTSGIDIDLRRVDIDQCPLPRGSTQLNIFAASDKCKKRTTECVPVGGLGFRRGSYKCVCKRGFYFPDTRALNRYYNGTQIEEEYEKLMLGESSDYNQSGVFECLACAEGCEVCLDESPCVVSLNWLLRTAILVLSCLPLSCLPFVLVFTWKYANVKVVRAASPVLLRVITLGAFFIYCTTIVMYPRPNIVTCTARVWLREIGFSLTYGALMLKTWRISVIFRVRSAKAVKITDMDLLKRLGMIVAVFSVLLVIRTLVAPPKVIVGKTADDLKAYLCQTDWWDHSFTILEVLFLIWGIRLCIVVRKAPSEFNESRFISMAIYNEFLLSLFLNISMLFLQSPANPDLLYIIFFCHTQMTVTLLLCFIFGSKAYLVFKGLGKSEDAISTAPQVHITKFINKQRTATSQYAVSTNSSTAGVDLKLTEQDVQEEFKRLYLQLEQLKEKNMRHGNRHLAARINAMQEAGRLQTTDETEETALDKTEESSFSNFNDSQGDGSQGKKIQGDCNDSIVLQSTKESLAKGSIQACEPILTDLALSKAVAKVGPNGKNNGKLPENGKGESTSAPGEATKAKVAPQVPARGMNKSMSKMPVHLNLDDTNRFTEEVTV